MLINHTFFMEAEDPKLKLLSIAGNMAALQITDPVDVTHLQATVQMFYNALKKVYDGATNYRLSGALNAAVSIEDSIQDDYIVCLEDGKKLQMLKRHLTSVYNMTPEQYRERWGLPHDYPMVAPNYATRRSEIAKDTGLGVTNRRAPGPRKKKVS
jgi:predicted transcriptional regulator